MTYPGLAHFGHRAVDIAHLGERHQPPRKQVPAQVHNAIGRNDRHTQVDETNVGMTARNGGTPSVFQSGSTISRRFGTKDKYSGADCENLREFVDEYDAMSRNSQLTPMHKLECVHNFFRRQALTYYNSRVALIARNYRDAIQMMLEKFLSKAKQQNIKFEISSDQDREATSSVSRSIPRRDT